LSWLLTNARYCYIGKPLIIEEFSYHGGGSPTFWGGVLAYRTEEQQVDWSTRFIHTTQGSAIGWLNWPLQDTPSATDVSKFAGFYDNDGKLKLWGKAFKKLAAQLKKESAVHREATVAIPFNRLAVLTDAVAVEKIYAECLNAFRSGGVMDFDYVDY
jgi:hypothetical protein